jgi:hypothetical protein
VIFRRTVDVNVPGLDVLLGQLAVALNGGKIDAEPFPKASR